MTTTPETNPHSLDDVFTEISALSAPPTGDTLREWLQRYPAFKEDITNFVAAWIDMESRATSHDVTNEQIDRVVNRTMSRVQQILDESERSAPMTDLTREIDSAGYTFESFQRSLGTDASILSCLADRMIRPSTIPLRLVRSCAELLLRSIDAVREYLRLPPQLASAYKARRQPEAVQEGIRLHRSTRRFARPRESEMARGRAGSGTARLTNGQLRHSQGPCQGNAQGSAGRSRR